MIESVYMGVCTVRFVVLGGIEVKLGMGYGTLRSGDNIYKAIPLKVKDHLEVKLL